MLSSPRTPEALSSDCRSLLGIQPDAGADVLLSVAAKHVFDELFGDRSKFAKALEIYRSHKDLFGVDWRSNSALKIGDGELFNDTTTDGARVASQDEYDPSKNSELYSINTDIPIHMAVVLLDPSRLGELTTEERQELLSQVEAAKTAAFSALPTDGSTTECALSPELKEILQRCLIEYGTAEPVAGSSWAKPFDIIATCKALYTLLSGDNNSGKMRQGGVLKSNKNGRKIITACSGFRSELDELIARTIADKVLKQPMDVAGYTVAIADAVANENYEEAKRLSDILTSYVHKLAKGAGSVSLSQEIGNNNQELLPGTDEWSRIYEWAKKSNIVVNPQDIEKYFQQKPGVKEKNINSQFARLWSLLARLSLLKNKTNARLAATNKNLKKMYGGIRFKRNAINNLSAAKEAEDLSLAGLMEYCEAVLEHYNAERSATITNIAVVHGMSEDAEKLLDSLLGGVGPANISNLLGVIKLKAAELA